MYPNKKRYLEYFAYFTITISFLIGLFVFVDKMHYFEIKKVIVNGKELNSSRAKALIGDSRNIYYLDIEKLVKRAQTLFKTHLIKVKKEYPSTLVIDVIEQDIIAVLYQNKKTLFYGLSKNGNFVKYFKRKTKYPLIKSDIWNMKRASYKLGEYVKDKSVLSLLFALHILKELNRDFFYRIKEVNLFDAPSKNYFLVQGLRTKFFFGKDIRLAQLFYVVSLIKGNANSVSQFKEIDMRFDKLIVGRKRAN